MHREVKKQADIYTGHEIWQERWEGSEKRGCDDEEMWKRRKKEKQR